jgi:UDP-2-acetamido-3-amino-2,3-dideoxy-glucuronate N-acetyltransferase
MIHSTADVQSPHIGIETSIWQFVVVLPHAVIGNNCNINAHCFIENDVIIGNNVTLKCGVFLWNGITLGNNVFVGPNVTFTNDKYPRSKQYPAVFLKTVIEDGVSLGAGSVILCGINIGKNSMIGAGSVVTKSVPQNQLWVGNPAKFVREL